MIRTGWLTAYGPQGCEGAITLAVYDKAYGGDENGSWDEAGVILLNNGDLLTIYSEADTVLWSGVIQKLEGAGGEVFDRNGQSAKLSVIFHDRERMPYSIWIQKSVDGATWMSWFLREKPLLRAELTTKTDVLN